VVQQLIQAVLAGAGLGQAQGPAGALNQPQLQQLQLQQLLPQALLSMQQGRLSFLPASLQMMSLHVPIGPVQV
jgi:hypothetical protein